MDQELIPKGAQIIRQRGVSSFASMILGSCIGNLIDAGCTDLEVLTIVEDLLKMRALVQSEECKALIEKQFEMAKKAMGSDS
jgi:hypothetical protein